MRARRGYPVTTVISRLVEPDGSPVQGRLVQSIIRAPSTWLADGSGRVVAEARTTTDDDGYWELALTPWEVMEHGEAVYYEIREGDEIHWVHIPISDTPLTLRQVLVNPPAPPSEPPIISSLGSLHNVDPGVDTPPRGILCALTSHGGLWGASPMRLEILGGMDSQSIEQAAIGAKLTFLPSGLWGADQTEPTPTSLQWYSDIGSTIWHTKITITENDLSEDVLVDWGDGTDPETIPAATTEFEHGYPVDVHKDYTVTVSYVDGSESDQETIPLPWDL